MYSTDQGRTCPECRSPVSKCGCRKRGRSEPYGDGIVRVGRQTKGRKGKGVTVVTGIPLGDAELRRLAGELKRKCGSGGTVRGDTIEIQGEHRNTLVEELTRRGYTVRRSGG